MPTLVTARDGDTLCGIAMDKGFLNCDPLRAEAANAAFLNRRLVAGDVVTVPDPVGKTTNHTTSQIHKFVKKNSPPVSIRLVHGSPDKRYLEDDTLTVLNISNYPTDKGGLEGNTAFPTGFGFNQNGHADEDTYKVEVVDPSASGTLHVNLEALRPFYRPDGVTVDHHDTFAGLSDEDDRKTIAVQCRQVTTGHVAFRSAYLRLVADVIDNISQQTLLITDAVDAGHPEVEILDQKVRATYVVQACNAAADAKCRVITDVPLAPGRKFDLAIRVMRATPTGVVETTPGGPGDDGIVHLADIRRRVQTFVRRCWAQSHIKPNIVLLQTMDLPSDSITVADGTGLPARGTQDGSASPGQIGFTLSVQRFGGGANSVHNVVPFPVPAGNTPQQTAALIVASVAGIPGVTATASPNPPEVGDPDGSCDVLFSAAGGRVTITNMTPVANQDGDQKVAAVALGMTVDRRNANDNYHVGHPQQRNLVKSLNSASDTVIDVTVIDNFPSATLMGFTVPELKTLDPDRQPVTGVKNSIIMASRASRTGDEIPFALAHEIGHVLTDEGRHALSNHEMMFHITPVDSASTDDSKRIVEHLPAANNWEITVQHTDATRTVGGRQTRLNATVHVNNIASPHLLH